MTRVVGGMRPAGFSSRRDTSRSPKAASVRVRGIGVALMARTSGARPFMVSLRRSDTPKRCCSSITTSPRSWNATLSWNRACVPQTTLASPDAIASISSALARPLSRPVRAMTRIPAGSSTLFRTPACWRATISVGAIRAVCTPASAACAAQSAATKVLPEPTSPWTSRIMRWPLSMSVFASLKARICAPVGLNGALASTASTRAPSPDRGRPLRARRSARAIFKAS